MKKIALLLIALVAISATAFAQNKPIYINISYHKLKPGHTIDEAMALENRWKTVHVKRKSLGLIGGWAVYPIMNEYKSESVDYDYVSLNASNDLNNVNLYPSDMASALMKEDPSLYALMDASAKVQSVIRNKITKVLESTGSSNDLNSVILMETMQTTQQNYFAYMDFERQIKAIQLDRIKAGNIQEWAFSQHLAPISYEGPGQFTTLTFFKDLSKLDFDASSIYINGAKKYMNLTPEQFTKKVGDLRIINQSVLLKYAEGSFN